ncbi:MAG: O-methyltransferase [Bacteroidetes bacterium]|nr:O-methyltransferase [Bacteroidota bacterium]
MATNSTFLTEDSNSYITELFSTEDAFLRDLNAQACAQGIPAISISPEQTGFLQVYLRSMQARRVLEIGSLAGYSAITMARALAANGSVVCCELMSEWGDFIEKKAREAGLGSVISVQRGPALATLQRLCDEGTEPFDVIFIDADKPNYVNYVQAAWPLLRVGGVIIGDNALAWGHVTNENTEFEPHNVRGIRAFNHFMAHHAKLQSTLVPLGDGMTIGIKLEH